MRRALVVIALVCGCSRGDDASLALPVPQIEEEEVEHEGPPPPPPPRAPHPVPPPREISGFLARVGTDPVRVTVGAGRRPAVVPADVASRLVEALGRETSYVHCCEPACGSPLDVIRLVHGRDTLELATDCTRLYYTARGGDGPFALCSGSMTDLLLAITRGAWDEARAVPAPEPAPRRRARKLEPPFDPPHAPPAHIARFLATKRGLIDVTLHWFDDEYATRKRSGPRVLGKASRSHVRLLDPLRAEVMAMLAADNYLDDDVGCFDDESVGVVLARGSDSLELVYDCGHLYTSEALHDGTFFVLASPAILRLDEIIAGTRGRRVVTRR